MSLQSNMKTAGVAIVPVKEIWNVVHDNIHRYYGNIYIVKSFTLLHAPMFSILKDAYLNMQS